MHNLKNACYGWNFKDSQFRQQHRTEMISYFFTDDSILVIVIQNNFHLWNEIPENKIEIWIQANLIWGISFVT